jgi:ribosome maturation factor RimP
MRRGYSMAESQTPDLRAELLEALEKKAVDFGTDIVEVEVVGVAKQPTVRVRIDHANPDDGPITLDEISAQTTWISDLIEELDPIDGPFTLEVSSPGLARPLRKRGDFERFAGETIHLKTTATEGRRKYTGTLKGMEGDDVVLECDDGTFKIAFDTIKTAKIKPSFD